MMEKRFSQDILQPYGSCKCNHMHSITFPIFHWLETSHRPCPHLREGDHTRIWTQEMRITRYHICRSRSTTNLPSKGTITIPESTNFCIWLWARVCQWQKLLYHLENISKVKPLLIEGCGTQYRDFTDLFRSFYVMVLAAPQISPWILSIPHILVCLASHYWLFLRSSGHLFQNSITLALL